MSAAVQRDALVTGVAAILAVMTMAAGCYLLVTGLRRSRRSHAALVASKERFRLLVQGVRDYAIYMLDREGNVGSWNAGAERIKGSRSA